MKPRIDFSKPVQTRAGLPVRLLCHDAKGNFPVVALIIRPDGKEEAAEHYTADGYRYSAGSINDRDLVNVPAVRTLHVWVSINRHGMAQCTYRSPTPDEGCLACKEVKITITEGEGITHGQST